MLDTVLLVESEEVLGRMLGYFDDVLRRILEVSVGAWFLCVE